MRMLKILMNNIKTMLNRFKTPFHKFQLSRDSGRIFFFFNNEDIPRAIDTLKNVIGIATFSPALRTSNKIKNISERAIQVGEKIFHKNNSFALRVRRTGKHDYTSHDIAVEVGRDIIEEFEDLNLSVNLTNPEKKIFIEVRYDFSYIFTNIIESKWGGLPIESNKKVVVMDIGRLNDLLAGFFLMKRGAQIHPILFNLMDNKENYEKWLANWREVINYTPYFQFIIRSINLVKIIKHVSKELDDKKYICGICRLIRYELISKILKELKINGFNKIRAISDGVNLNNLTLCPDEVDLDSLALNYLFSEYPIFTPLIGLDSNNIKENISKLSKNLTRFNYCCFKPKNQEFNGEILKSLYRYLNLNKFITDCLKNIEEIRISN